MIEHYCWPGKIEPKPSGSHPRGKLSNLKRFTVLLSLLMIFSGIWSKLYAEGSKDLYPAGISGNRAFLYSNTSNTAAVSWPFKTIGVHYVYVNEGETVSAAMSSQGISQGRIRLTSPDGIQYTSANDAVGRIVNRAQELAGPQYPGQGAGGNRYLPYTVTAAAGQGGVWKVEFIPTGGESVSGIPSPPDLAADAEWSGQQGSNSYLNNGPLIAAWDVSVRNAGNTAWVDGRVYANVFNMHINSNSFSGPSAFYGKLYVLTSDGIAYLVTNNGTNGAGFTFFVNNKGFIDASGSPLYKSLNTSSPSGTWVHDPREADDPTNVTHKIFYTTPASDLPASATQAISTSQQVTTWLKNTPVIPVVSNVTYTGIEGTPNLSGNKGANIGFDSNLSGSYRIEIAITGYTTRVLTGNTAIGANTVFWDGKDGAGSTLAPSTSISEIKVQLFGAEVHFPFIDMEINPGGITIEQLDASYALYSPTKDLVYWDDLNVTGGNTNTRPNPMASGAAGISSTANGHKWGRYGVTGGSGNSGEGSNSFGNEKALDTWSFVPGNIIIVPLNIVIASADLEVESIVPSTNTITIGESLSYDVVVKNNGPSDVSAAGFTFNVLAGFTIGSVSYVTNTGTVVVINGTVDPVTGDYTADLDMTNGAEIVFTITGTVGNALGGVNMTMEASIIRPNDVTDPDATNPGLTPPTDPHLECLNGTAIEACNNIAYNTIVPAALSNLTLVKTTNVAVPNIGQQVIFTIAVTNNGPNSATAVAVTDQLPSGFTYVSNTVTAGTYNNSTGIWTIGTVANSVTRTMTITATVNASGNYTNVATVSGAQVDPTPTDNSDDATSAPNPADLSIDKAVNNLTPNVGSQVQFTLIATNNGPGTATNVIVNDLLPSGYTYVSHSTGSYVPATGIWSIGSIANNGSASLIITAIVNATGNYTNSAAIDGDEDDTDTTNNTDTVTIVPKSVIDAVNNTVTNVNGYTGATNVANVLTNDTLNGVAVIPSQVTLTEGTGDTDELTINTNGSVDVAPGTPAGTYTLGYTICEVLNPTNCDNATVTVTVIPAPIDAVNNTVTNVNGYTGGTGVANVLANDTLNGVAVIPSQVTLTEGTGDTDELTINTNGTVDVAQGTPAGTYTLGYTICEVLNPTNCDNATVTVTVIPAPIDAVNNTVTNVNGYTGGTGVANVLANDTLNGVAVIPSQVTLTEGTGDTDELTINTNGTVDVAQGTPAGTYTLGYTICEVLNPTNCDNATVTVTVIPAPIDAVNNTVTNVNGYTGGTGVANVLANDTLNGVAVIPSQVTLTEGTGDTDELTINTNGTVDVAQGTPAGTYTLGYTICEVLNPTNCDTATVTVTVIPAPIDAVNDTLTNVNGYTGGTGVTNALTNDTLNGVTVVASEVTLTEGTGDTDELTINTNGTVDVAPGTPAGTYTLGYTICEVLNPTNCDTATVTVTVIPAPIDAVNDTLTNVNGYTGGTGVTNVLANDTLNGVAVIPSQVTLTEDTGDTDELTINTNGSVDVAPGTPAGTYTLGYTICEVLNPTNCDTATVSVTVVAAPIDAVNDTVTNVNGYTGGTGVANVLTNDTLNGVAVVPSEVTLTEGTGDTDELTINTNGSVDVVPGTPAGTYTLGYTICEVLNPANCDTATVTVTVVAASIDAVNDTVTNVNGYTGGTGVANVLTNDTLNGVTVIASEVTLTEGTGDTDELTINTNGSVDVAPGTPAGTYTLGYTICEVLNPTNCDTATVTVTVVAAPIDAVNDTVTNVNGPTGETDVVNVLTNDTLNGLPVIHTEITITTITGNPQLILDPVDGSVDVLPNTPGGTYEITYQICEILNPANCETATVTIFVMEPKFTLTKDAQAGTYDSVGDVITYNLALTNTGNVALDNIAVTDATADSITPSTVAIIAPGEIVNIVATHTITQSDLDSGFVYNTASATGTDPKGGSVSDDSSDPTDPLQPGEPGYNPACADCTVTTITQSPSITLTKDAQAGVYDSVGDVITYNLVLTNTGNVTLDNIAIADANADSITPSTAATIAPGETVNIVAIHTITQSDLDSGFVYNTASVSGNDPKGGSVTDTSSDPTDPLQPGDTGYDPACANCTVAEITQLPSLTLTKDAQAGIYDSVGDIILYNLVLTNTGNVTINDIVVLDANADNVSPPTVAVIEPGQSVNITASHSITQSDIDAGFVYNTAQVSGTDPSGAIVTDESSDPTDPAQPGDSGYDPTCADCTLTQINQNHAMELLKEAVYQDANGDGKVNPGDTILYSFSIENTGNTTITDIVVEDPLVTVNGGPIASLAPGIIDTATFNALYVITQDDIETGAIYNLALADGLDPKGNPVNAESKDPTPISENDPLFDASCPDCTVISLTQAPSMALVKTAVLNDENNDGSVQAGETISYSFKVVNTGTVALYKIVITDALPGVVLTGGPIAMLEVGQEDTTTYTATYTITQADINAGMVTNQAIAQSETSTGGKFTVTSDDSDVVGNDPTVTELNGCAIEIFNAISADANGDNDEFFIGGIECYPDNEVRIFNRWGVLVYDVKGYDNNEKAFRGYSDGRVTVSGSSSLPAGTYFYVIQYKMADGSTHKKDGYLYITR